MEPEVVTHIHALVKTHKTVKHGAEFYCMPFLKNLLKCSYEKVLGAG